MCPECKNAIISDSYKGETICESCGLVISEKALDISNFDKNMYTYGEKRDRARSGFVDILFTPKFYFHTRININEAPDHNFKRIARLDNHNNDSGVRNLLIAIRVLKQMSSSLLLPYSIREKAMLLYRKALKKDFIKGRSLVAMMCACVYYSCRKSKIPISFKEIVKEGGTNARFVIKFYKLLAKEFNLKVPPLEPVLFVSRYITELQLGFKIEQKVLSILKSLPFSFINGKEPKSLIAAIIYSLGKKENIKITQKTLAQMTGTCEVAIRYKSREIEQIINSPKVLKM